MCDVKFSCNMILIIILGELLYAKHYLRYIETKITVETPNVAAYADQQHVLEWVLNVLYLY